MAITKITIPELFNLQSNNTEGTQLPVMTTTQKEAMTGMSNGELIFNSTTDFVEYYDLGATAWYKIDYEAIPIITQNLELYYDITSSSTYNSGTTITDQSGQGNNGSISGGLNSATTTAGIRYLDFDGSNDYIAASSGPIVDTFSSDFTAEFWINYQIVSGEQGTVFGFDGSSSQRVNNYLNIDLRSGQNKYKYNGWGMNANQLETAVGTGDDYLNQWVYVVATLDVSSPYTRALYINGSLLDSNTGRSAYNVPSNIPMAIMAYTYRGLSGAYGNLKGYLSKVRMSSAKLDAADILNNFNAEKGYYGI